ncbi:hypothetical protein MASR1M32_35920 [Rhodobacter sp.]
MVRGGLVAGVVIGAAALLFPHQARLGWQIVSAAIVTPSAADTPQVAAAPEAGRLIRAAEGQVGVTTVYDPAYVTLDFPGGDVPQGRGVCTDVVIRALREAHGIDLQLAVNTDMKANFSKYPANWGLTRTDRNIDHRRVPNMAKLLQRMGAELPLTSEPADFQPGDIVTSMLPGNLPHVMIVTDRPGAGALMVVHNIGAGTRIEDRLFEYPLTGHYRLTPEVLARMRALGG